MLSIDDMQRQAVDLFPYQRSFVERLMDWLKGIIEKIKGGPHNKTIEADLRYLNERLAKVYDSAVDKNKWHN